MDFFKMRSRIVFLKPTASAVNELDESVPLWVPYHPQKGSCALSADAVYITEDYEGNAAFCDENGDEVEIPRGIPDYEVWAYVAPKTGREYDEAQKLRSEVTYNVLTRYFEDIDAEMKILYRGGILNIISVLDTDGRREQLQITAAERSRNE